MRINAHAHIFNLQTVLTEEAVGIMVGRLERLALPDFVVEAVRRILVDQLRRPEYMVEEELLRRFLGAISRSRSFQRLVADADTLPVEVRVLGGGIEGLAVDTLRASLDRLSTHIDRQDESGSGVFDVFETLRIAMQPDIVAVADRLLADMGPDDALVALMMDIVGKEETTRDRNNFLAQLNGTSEAAVQRPGRVLPFVAVNPTRANHFDVMRRAIEEMGFVGVKLYPSLGYEVGTSDMQAVLDYCAGSDTPVLVHCTRGGFFKSPDAAEYCDPAHWRPLLEERPDLRICFAHFGGWGGLSGIVAEQKEWSDEILALMEHFANVYADISYHVDMMAGGDAERQYLEALHDLLDHEVYGDRILFGTDAWLVRLHVSDQGFWRYFEDVLREDAFAKAAERSPRTFLGLPDEQGVGMRENVVRHVAFLEARSERVGAPPAAWVRSVSNAVFTPTRANPRWSPNNRAHVFTYKFFRHVVMQIPARFHGQGFDGAGKLRLRQLGYWTKEHEAPALFDQRRLDNAVKLESYCRTNGAGYEGDYDRDSSIEKLTELFGDGDRTLADAAAAVDAIFLFPNEIA